MVGRFDDSQQYFEPSTAPSWEAADLNATGRWATISENGTEIGKLFSDDVASVGFFVSQDGNETAKGIRQQVNNLAGTPADQAFNNVLEGLVQNPAIAVENFNGKMIEFFQSDTPNDPLSISVENDSTVVALVDTNGAAPKVRENGRWVEVSVDDPRVDGIPVHFVDDDAIDLWDNGTTNFDGYEKVILDEQ